MRCATCGIDNEPDSRFCGGCGARLAGESRLAPTQKIDTGAQPVQQQPISRPPESSRVPDSRPPRQISGSQNVPPASYPLTPSVQRPPRGEPQALHTPARGSNGVGTSQQPGVPARSRADASASLPPKRRVGLIVAVLLVDVALAAAGAYLLAAGLATPTEAASSGSAAPAGSGSPAEAKAAPAPPPDAAPIDAAVTITPIPIDAAAIAATPPDAAVKKPATQSRKKAPDRKQTTQPVDPYDAEEGPGPSDPFPPDLPPPPPPPPS